MKNENIKSLLKSFLGLSLIIMVVALITGAIILIFEIIGGTITLQILLKKIMIAIVILGYSIVIYVLLGITKTLNENPFVKSNIKKFSFIGKIFFIETAIEAIHSSILNPNEGIVKILGVNITISLITLVITTLTFFLISDIFTKAIKVKEENELTI